ncbi:MAG: TIGR02996 domain-containing protein [Planctomycetia bacterium]|nr:TIGR02996 domain-containing protein [Planctomycetia bacterium]
MTDRETLLSAIARQPGDDIAWLALADCLEEEGHNRSADLLRLTRQLRGLARTDAQRAELEKQLTALLKKKARPIVPEFVNSLGMRFALVPPGIFWMGSPDKEPERHSIEHLHEVEITRGFWIGVVPVTQSEYETVMGSNPSHFRAGGAGSDAVADMDTSSFPVENVNWRNATRFCSRLGRLPPERKAKRKYRLPTEAEWEYACRAMTTTAFAFGTSLSSRHANVDGNQPGGRARTGPYLDRTCPVGQYLPNAFGLYDMHGQVWEWCSDYFDPDYGLESPRVDPQGPEDGDRRVLRGGSWYHYTHVSRSATRIRYAEEIRYDNGLRVVMMPS